MIKVQYGAWIFTNPTLTISCTPLRDLPGHRVYAQRLIFTIRAIVTQADVSAFEKENLYVLLNDAIIELKKAKKRFKVTEGAEILYEIDPIEDLSAGPWPTIVDTQMIIGGQSALITWQLEATTSATIQYKQDILDGKPPLNYQFAYTIATSLDQDFYATRTLSGIMRCYPEGGVGSDDTVRKRGADWIRAKVTSELCACPKGWQRISMNFQESEDALALVFNIVDRQQFVVLPEGCTSGDASLTVSGMPGGGEAIMQLSGYFEAPMGTVYETNKNKNTAPAEAFMQLFNAVIPPAGVDKISSPILKNVLLRRTLFRNRLDFSVTYSCIPVGKPVKADDPKFIPQGLRFMSSLLALADPWLKALRDKEALTLSGNGTTLVGGKCGGSVPTANAKIALSTEGRVSLAITQPAATAPSLPLGDTERKASDNDLAVVRYHASFAYSGESGKVILPAAGNTTIYVQQVHAPINYLIVTGTCTRMRIAPEPPPIPVELKENHLLSYKVTTEAPQPGEFFTISWEYVIVLAETPKVLRIPESAFPSLDALSMPEMKWSKDPKTGTEYIETAKKLMAKVE